MKYLIHFSRIFLAAVFIFSGFVKGVDPLGTTYKFADYFNAFHLGFLSPLSFPLAILLNGAEFLMGVALLANLRTKFMSWLVLGFMLFFTVLTFILAIYNPVTDCGCFGDALVLTNWQTFWKNVLIIIFVVFLFINRNKLIASYKALTEWLLIAGIALVFVIFSYFNYNHLPIMDFRPYAIGTNIPEKMLVPEDAPQDVYKTVFFYKEINTGSIKEFDENNYPWEDTLNWEFVSYDTKLLSKGYEPPIHNFSITSLDNQDITDSVLMDKGYSFLLISHKMEKADTNALKFANVYFSMVNDSSNFKFYCLTASPTANIISLKKKLKLEYPVFTCDEITLKTIIRSNPGLVLIKDGVVVGNWHYNDFPSVDVFSTNYQNKKLEEVNSEKESITAYFLLAVLLLTLTSMKILLSLLCNKSKTNK